MNLFNLDGKIALITGGNGGIGLGIAKGFLSHGASVALLGRNKTKLENSKNEIIEKFGVDRVMALQCDVTNRHEIATT